VSKAIVVLNDGETYTDIEGCKIIVLTKAGEHAIMNEMAEPDLLEERHIYEVITLHSRP